MGRFYNTTQRNFVDDFVFQPDMALAERALLKKDNDIKQQIQTMDLFENLPIDFWDEADGENARRIKDEYSNRVADIARQMQGDLTNTGGNQRLINSLRRDIERDWEFGDISKIQKNAAAYREFDELLKTLPNPADREGYKRMVQDYLDNSEGQGALSSIFKPEELYNQQDYWKLFTESGAFKNLQPDAKSSNIAKIGGQWVVQEGNSTTSLSESKIGQAFKAFIDSQGLQGYGSSRQKYFNENWLDESGNIRFDDNSYLGNIMANGIPSLAYNQVSHSTQAQANPYGLAADAEAREIRKENRIMKTQQALSQVTAGQEIDYRASKRVLNNVLFDKEKKEVASNKLSQINQMFGLNVKREDLDTIINYAKKNNSPKMAAYFQDVKNMYNEGPRASFGTLAEFGNSKAQIDLYEKNLLAAMNKNGYNTKGIIDFTGSGLNVEGNMSKQLSLNELKNAKLANGSVITNAEIIKDSSMPLIFGDDETKNKVQSSVKLTVIPKIKTKSGSLTDGDPVTTIVDMYHNTYDITGNSRITVDAAYNFK